MLRFNEYQTILTEKGFQYKPKLKYWLIMDFSYKKEQCIFLFLPFNFIKEQ